MSCYRPLIGVPDYNPITGKPYKTKNGKNRLRILKMDSKDDPRAFGPDVVQIPCGNCIGCRLDYSRQWANRCMLELGYHESAYFLTLTYNDGNLPTHWYVDESTGEASEVAYLDKRDWQLFMKRLRRALPNQKLRFFMAGEYGEQNMRPHFHAIVFGLKLDDLKFYKHLDKYDYFTSEFVNSIWDYNCLPSHDENSCKMAYDVVSCKWSSNPLLTRGLVIIGEVNWDTCAYTARYVMSKMKGPSAEFYPSHGLTPPFTLMSRKPGIGAQYFEDHPELYDYAYINVSTPQGGKKFPPPKYFDRLLDKIDPERLASLKAQRQQLASEYTKLKLQQTDLSYLDFLEVQEESHEDRIKSLERRL